MGMFKMCSLGVLPTYVYYTPETDPLAAGSAEIHEYLPQVGVNARKVQKEAVLRLDRSGIDLKNVAVLTTGSDGRLEKSNYSKVELIVVFDSEQVSLKDLKATVDGFVRKKGANRDLFDHRVEYQDLHTKTPCFYSGNKKIVYPSRPFDSVFLTGDVTLFDRYLTDSLNQVSTMNRKARNAFSSAFKRSVESTRTWLKELSLVSGSKARIAYDQPDAPRRVADAKYRGLRAVQYKAALLLCDLVRKTRGDEEYKTPSLLEAAPKSVVDRLGFLFEKELIFEQDKTGLRSVQQAYSTMLYWYHRSEDAFLRFGQTYIEVDRAELVGVLETILSFADPEDV